MHSIFAKAVGGTWRWIAMFVLWPLLAGAEDSALKFRGVSVRVVDEEGVAVSGVRVALVGTDRDALGSLLDDAGGKDELAAWRFVANAQGRCAAQFGCFRTADSEKLAGRWTPGWGRFYFVAESGGRRAVSMCVINLPAADRHVTEGDTDDEWARRGVVRLTDAPVELTLRLMRGLRVTGRVIDPGGRPVRGFVISLSNDLHAGSHTGYGGKIFPAEAVSDGEGRFVFEHVYPNTFYLGPAPHEERTPVWVRTRVRGRWAEAVVDMITPRRGEKAIALTLGVSPKLPFRYFGRVADETGKPVAGAKMTFGISRHRTVRTHADNHTFLPATTDEGGRFEILTASPYIRFVRVSAPGFADFEGDYEDRMRAPGKWDFTLRRR